MSLITISGKTVTILRSALLSDIGGPAGHLEQASVAKDKEKRPELFRSAISELSAYCLLLDAIGWSEPDDPSTQGPRFIDFDLCRRLAADAMRTKLIGEQEFVVELSAEKEQGAVYEQALADIKAIERFLVNHDSAAR
jgi:hypothetical protein